MKHFGSVCKAAFRFISGKCQTLALLWRSLLHPNVHRFRTVSGRDIGVTQDTVNNLTAKSETLGKVLDGFSGEIAVDKVVSVKIIPSGQTATHVYNLQTENGYYFVNSSIAQSKSKCNGIFAIAKNCRCTLIAAVDGVETSNAQRRVRNPETGKNELVSDMTYQEWAGWKEKAQVQKAMEQPKVFHEEDYRAFETGEQTNDFFYYDDEKRGLMARKKSAHGQWTSGLSQEEARAIGQYCADGYYDINNYWRKYGDWQDINAERVKHQTEMLDGVIARYDLKEPIKVYRAIQPEAFESYWDDIQKIVGTEYTDAGFMSTSPIKTSTAVNKDCIMELFIPSGKGRGAYINNVSGFQDEEYEFLLARDSKFRVIGAEETEDKLILKMEWIGNGQ